MLAKKPKQQDDFQAAARQEAEATILAMSPPMMVMLMMKKIGDARAATVADIHVKLGLVAAIDAPKNLFRFVMPSSHKVQL